MNSRLLIVEDHPLVIKSLCCVFEDVDVQIETASTCADAIRIVQGHCVDVVLLDIELPDGSGLDVLREVKMLNPSLPVVMHSSHEGVQYYAGSYRLGACGYVAKGTNVHVLINCVRQAARGDNAWSKEQMLEIQRAGDHLASADIKRTGDASKALSSAKRKRPQDACRKSSP